ncbi:two-component regulator propeller domain-containing protein [Nibrella saemangeumensis]|uniref:histidine kinase n=1 Tax=Nibrella saemangeumensis TaxID=1084526 RepID=A0ABP8NDH4_9BACT
MRVRYLLVLVLLLLTARITCQAQAAFKRLTTSDGLSHNIVNTLIQDQNGFLWLGTADGLNRYDGQKFQIYRRSQRDPRSISSNEITCLLEDRRHQLWVGTRSGGLNLLAPSGVHFDKLSRTATGADIATTSITDLVQDATGHIWAATYGQGVLTIDPATRQVRQFTAKADRLPSDVIQRLCFDVTGNLWLGSAGGTIARMRLTDNTLQVYKLPSQGSLSSGNTMTMLCDSRGTIWVGTQGWGLFRYNPQRDQFESVFFRPRILEGINIARSLYEDKTGRYWLGTDDGLVVAENARFEQISHYRANPADQHSLSTHAMVCVRGDRQGNIWIGTWEGGLNVLFKQPDSFEQYTHQIGQKNSLPTQKVSAVLADSLNNVWLGSSQGLSYLDRKTKTFRHFSHQPGKPGSLAGNDVTDIHRLSDRALLVNVWNEGSDVFDPRTGQVVRHITTLKPAQIHSVVPTAGNKAWIATNQGGIWRMDLRTWQIEPVRAFPWMSYSFTTLVEAPDSTLWIGTYGNGLLEWQRRTGKLRVHRRMQQAGGLLDNHIICLLVDSRKRVWVGTSGGLHRYDHQRKCFELISTENGLSNDAIMSIREDTQGNLWVGTNDGLCRIDRTDKVVRTYRQSDGLPGNDFTERAVSQSPNGTLFWGGKHGLTVFHPKQLEATQPTFPVYLTGLKLFNKTVVPGAPDAPLTHNLTETRKMTLRHNQSVVTFDFSAVLFQAYRNVRYAYRLENFEPTWNYVGSQSSATYTNLDPGTYLFRVKAALSDDFRQASETVLQLTVLPPWYRTNWAYLLYALLVAGLLALIRRIIQIREGYKTELRLEHLETEKARELDRLRSGFFTNISHEFRTPLTLILTPLEQFLADLTPDRRRGQFQTMHQNARRLLRLINQLLDLSKLESGSLKPDIMRLDVIEFVRRVVNSFEPAALQQRVTLTIEADLTTYTGYFDPDILEKVLYNLIANALKYTSEGGMVTIRCAIHEPDAAPELRLEVEDTGIGISAEHISHIFDRFYQVNGQHRLKKAGTGIGLALTRELIELHQGNVQVESQPGAGTVFMVVLPLYEAAFPADWLSNRATDSGIPLDSPATYLDTHTDDTPRVAVSSGDKPLLLVVEDHDDLRHYLADCFQPHYRVLVASNGQEAMAQAEKEVPDLIISDWLMPDMDGVQLCEAIKTNEKTSHVPLILLTSRSSNESKVQGLTVGADDYITKPFNVSVLQTRATNLIQGRKRLRAKFSRMLYLQPADVPIESAEEQFLKKAIAFIETHLADPELEVQQLEQELGMSNTQLYRKLKALTGKGGNDLIRNIRLQRAARLLQTSGRQVAEVAYQVGFNDPNYFIRAFRKEFGVSPGEYAKTSSSEELTSS